MAAPLAALLARAAPAIRSFAASGAARAGATQAGQSATATAQAGQAREAMRYGVRLAQEAAFQRATERAQGRDGSITTTFNQAKGALAYGWKTRDAEAIQVGISKLVQVGKAAAPLPGILAALAVGFALLPKKLADFGSSLLESRRQFAEFSGGYAATFARLDAQRFGRSVRLAGMTSGTSAQLAASTSRLEERLLPYAAAGINVLNKILVVMQRTAEIGLSIAEAVAETSLVGRAVKAGIDRLAEKDSATSGHLQKLSEDIAGGSLSKRRWGDKK